MAQVDVTKLDKKKLRVLADEIGVSWNKQTDDEVSLRKKIRSALDKSARDELLAASNFDTSKRGPTKKAIDPSTGKETVVFLDCFGWAYAPFYDANNTEQVKACTQRCAHSKACAALTKGSDKVLAKLAEQEQAEEEAQEVTSEDLEAVKKASTKKPRAEKATIVKGEEKKSTLSESSVLEVRFDMVTASSEADEQWGRFYRRIAKRHEEGSTVEAGEVAAVLIRSLELPEEEHEAVYTDLLPVLLENGYFKRVG